MGEGQALALVLAVALVLGLRHAADPDHLAAVSMAALSSAFGCAITRGPVLRRMLAFAPAMGFATLAFGGWYALGAMGAVPYLL